MANVLTLIPYNIFPAKLGGQKGIAFFYKYFSKYQNVTAITIQNNDPKNASYTVLNILSDSKFRYINLLSYFKIKTIIKNFKIDALIIEHPYFGWLGMLAKSLLKVRLIVHSHNIESQRFKSLNKWWWKILWYYEKAVHSYADATFCKTEEDRNYMIEQYKVPENKCHVITYGIDWNEAPPPIEQKTARSQLLKLYNLEDNTVLFLFNGTLNYPPNYQAVQVIVDIINKEIINKIPSYKIIICGKGLPESDHELKDYVRENIIYAGFVEDIDIYFRGADVFINPVIEGGGIKTKLVEAIGSDLNAISTISGGIGISEKICNHKLTLSLDNDWTSFANNMIQASQKIHHTGPEFFEHFYWDSIAKKASDIITSI